MKEQYAKCIPFDASVKGRIGGNPPQIVENSIPEVYLYKHNETGEIIAGFWQCS